jgi:predicted HTH transcriptional regulator
MDIKNMKKEKYIEDSAIKTIAAFLNSKGGTLLCGADDNGALIGLNDEISLFYKSSDAFLLHVKNIIKQRIGSEFYPFINFKLMNIADILILEFTCSFSNLPVFVDEKDFYVRTNPATDKLDGRKQFEYISNRFK